MKRSAIIKAVVAFISPLALNEASATEFHGSVELEFSSAYVDKGMIFNDEPIAAISPTLEWYFTEDFFLGGNFWQLYDLTGRRRSEDECQNEWKETDFEVFLGGTFWKSEDKEYALNALVGYYWETGVIHDKWVNATSYPYLKGEFENPFLTPFLQLALDYDHTRSLLMIAGVKHDFELTDTVTFTPQLTAFGGHKRIVQRVYCNERGKTGIASLEGRLTLDWSPVEWMKISCFAALNAMVNSRITDDWGAGDEMPSFQHHEQLVFGGVSAAFEF